MHKVKVLVTCKRKVIHSGLALILNSTDSLEIVGRDGYDVLEEATELQPDVVIYDLCLIEDNNYDILLKLKEMCCWTKIIIYTPQKLKQEKFINYLKVCDGYIQGPLLPGLLVKAMELICSSNYFFFLGSPENIKAEVTLGTIYAI